MNAKGSSERDVQQPV